MTLDIAALRKLVENQDDDLFVTTVMRYSASDVRLRVRDLRTLLDAAEERDILRASLDVSRYVERTDAFLARARAAEAQRDALLAAAEVVGRYRNIPHIACGEVDGMECECGATDFNAALDAMRSAIAAAKEAP